MDDAACRSANAVHAGAAMSEAGGALKLRDMLQRVEDSLIAAGLDDFWVATRAGTFHWTAAVQPPRSISTDGTVIAQFTPVCDDDA